MRFSDLVRLALANVRRNRTRSLLTLAGVGVGVGALLTLIAYGAALQNNARGEFERLDLFNMLRVTSKPDPFGGGPGGMVSRVQKVEQERPEVPITDSLVAVFRRLPGVLDAYPEVRFPAQIEAKEREVFVSAEAVPLTYARLDGYRPTVGAFFASDTASAVLMAPSMAERLGYEPAAAAVGDTVTLVTATLDLGALQAMAGAFSLGLGTVPTREHRHRVRVEGLLPEEGQALSSFVRVLLPQGRAERMEKTTFFSTLDLMLRRSNAPGGYAAVRVQLDDPDALAGTRQRIEAAGVYVTSLRDQFAQLDRLFLIVDFALAIVGLIALLVATLGIANTMTMNVVERRREIGVMKAVGGEEAAVVRLFVAESGVLGLIGGVLGLAAGFAVMAGIQVAVSAYLTRKSLPDVDVFAPSALMVAGVTAVALAVSLLAGLAPARRAARVEPVEALRA
jgi:putative ABC transport system permease protein